MPVVLDRLPLPNLTWYTGFSILLLGFSIYYAGIQVRLNPNWRDKFLTQLEVPVSKFVKQKYGNEEFLSSTFKQDSIHLLPKVDSQDVVLGLSKIYEENFQNHCYPRNYGREMGRPKIDTTPISRNHERLMKTTFRPIEIGMKSSEKHNKTVILSNHAILEVYPYIIPEVLSFMFHEPLCIWTLINMAYCILILLGTTIQVLVFGELRVSEQQHIKDKFWNFVFYKFVFVFGVMNVQAMGEGILWCSWFSVLGFLHLLAQLCRDRFEYLSFSPSTPRRTHYRLLGLLSMILLLAGSCLMISIFVGSHAGLNTLAFMLAECVLLIIRTLNVIVRYSLYLWDINHEGLWEKRGRYIYWTELLFELSELIIDMVHHIHMLVWANMLLTMASLVICMQLRLLFYQLQHKIKSHKNYLKVVRLIKRYPEVKGLDLPDEENTCAICWESVEVGRLLDCNHVFHSSCLLAWLHHDLSCPTCRDKLCNPEKDVPDSPSILDNLLPSGIDGEETEGVDVQNGNGSYPSPAAPEGMSGSNGWRYVSWLPSFSVEQSHTQLPRHHQVNSQTSGDASQLDNLARQVHQIFPDISYTHIMEDLRRTRSIDDTIDNFLAHPHHHNQDSHPPMFSGSGVPCDESSFTSSKHEDPRVSEVSDASSHEQKSPKIRPFRSLLLEVEDPVMKESSDSEESESYDKQDPGWPGGYFSKSAREREHVLSQRKQELLALGRQKFACKVVQPHSTQTNKLATNSDSTK